MMKAAKPPAAATLNDRIRADIETRIFSGTWPPGHPIPNEHKLAELYSCSRMTVNKVLSDLAAKGIVERKRKAGTVVGKPVVQSAVLRIPEIKAEVEALGYAYRYELLRLVRRRASRADRSLMQLDPRARVVDVQCRHWADERPFAFEHRFLNLGAVPAAAEEDFATVPPGSWLLTHVPWTQAEHRIAAQEADADLARALALAPGAACLVVQRRTWRAGDVITHVRTVFPSALYAVTAHFTPTHG